MSKKWLNLSFGFVSKLFVIVDVDRMYLESAVIINLPALLRLISVKHIR